MATEIELATAFCDQAVLALNRGELSAQDAAMAKWWATELQGRVVDRCVQLHGGYGYMLEYPIARAYVDARVTRIYGGTTEIMKEIIGRSLGVVSPVGAARITAARRGRRPRTYDAVLHATAQLLETTPLSELSVAQILEAAGVGRTSFYEHFSSKDDVVVKLMRSIAAEVGEELEPLFHRGQRSPEAAVRDALGNVIATASRHARLLVTVAEEWPAVPELRTIWFDMLGDATSRLAETIERERAAGAAPPGADSRALAASLVWTAERSFHVAMTGADRTLSGPGSLLDPLVQLFVGAIYGRAPTPLESELTPPRGTGGGRRLGA